MQPDYRRIAELESELGLAVEAVPDPTLMVSRAMGPMDCIRLATEIAKGRLRALAR